MTEDRITPMKGRCFLSAFLLSLAVCIASAAHASGPAGLDRLAISEGRWVYHGHVFADARSRPTAFVWNADCRWAANRAFMLCSFSNDWARRHVNSLVVDTFNGHAHAFWHYEIFENGDTPGNPFASTMKIDGPIRTETWTESRHGKPIRQRIVYDFVSDRKVTVTFQQSEDGKSWKTTGNGTGEKTGS